jgi:ribonucleoside-diphosphate reductase alpha chain
MGLPYDSAESRAICGALTAILTGEAYATSARIAKEKGPFPGYKRNREPMLRVIRNHRRAAYNEGDYEGLSIRPVGSGEVLGGATRPDPPGRTRRALRAYSANR